MTETRNQMFDRQAREFVERTDVLETELPRGVCSVRGCKRGDRIYPFEGFNERTFWVCSRHRPMYRRHKEILRRIRSL